MILPDARILCVEDDKDWCELMELIFEQAGENYKLTFVSSVREASILVENISYDLYVLDYSLPDGTGVELCRKIRQTNANSPVLFYSAMARKIDRQIAMKAGATEYLVKPDDLNRFINTVKCFLKDKIQPNPCVYGLANFGKS